MTVRELAGAMAVGLLMWIGAFLLLMQAFSFIDSLY